MRCGSAAIAGVSFPPSYSGNSTDNFFASRRETISLVQNCNQLYQIPPIHAKTIRNGQQNDPFVVFELLRITSKFNSINYASRIFHHSQTLNVYLYTALIDGFVSSGRHCDGIRLYRRMLDESIKPDNYALTSVLRACAFQLALKEGRQVHGQVLKLGISSDRLIRLKLIDLYGKCAEFADAQQLFDEMPQNDGVASTVMITSYMNQGLVEKANEVFNRVRPRDTVCWTAMINGLVSNGEMMRALELFRQMQMENGKPNEVTIVCVLSACSQLGALELGRWVHSFLEKYEIKVNPFVGGALINMYSKCGSLGSASLVFEEMKVRDITTYNAMIAGLAMHGKGVEAIEMFLQMKKKGFAPNSRTLVSVLNACSHGALVELGFEIFNSMKSDCGIEPQIEHYGCVIDLLCRVGRLEEAYNFVTSMRVAPDQVILGSLLSACKLHGNLVLGEHVAKILMDCGAADSGTYVLLSSVFASLGRWKEAAGVRAMMEEAGVQKEPGCSTIEVNNEIHEFLLGDTSHPERLKIYGMLKLLNHSLKLEG